MGWSTSELAQLTGTTVNAIRHYHKLELLAEPERLSNGYKQYGASHMFRLLQIRRMRELGVPLTGIDAVQDDLEQQQLVLKDLDVELGKRIAELEKVRDEIALMIEHGAPIDTASDFIDLATRMSPADRTLMNLYSRLYEESALKEMKIIMSESSLFDSEVDDLPADADEVARAQLAEKIAPLMKRQLEDDPWMLPPSTRMVGDVKMGQAAIIDSMSELYNEAQIDVFQRAFVQIFPDLRVPDEHRERFIAFVRVAAGEESA